MKTVVVYESMYGNTHHVAECIAEAARSRGEVAVVTAADATVEVLNGADFVIVGAPTHAHGLPSATTRRGAVDDAPKKHLELDPDADGTGLREWFDGLGTNTGRRAVAFDTRMTGRPALTGRASKGIGKRLRQHGFRVVAEPESFLVDHDNHLLDGEADRARAWAADIFEYC